MDKQTKSVIEQIFTRYRNRQVRNGKHHETFKYKYTFISFES